MSASGGVPIDVTDGEWESRVLGDPRPALVDFWAPSCVPCRKIEPTVRDLAAQYAGRLLVARVDVDTEPRTAGRYDVLSLPTVILFRDGAPVERLAGGLTPARLEAAVAGHLSDSDTED